MGDSRPDDEFGAEFIDLSKVQFTPELLKFISAEKAQKHQALPVGKTRDRLTIAMADPTDLNFVDYLCSTFKLEIEIQVADAQQIRQFVRLLYGGDESTPPISNN
jgi:type IV pilus assembly protein PilB